MPPQKKLKLSEATETYISADKKLSLPNFLKMLGAGGLSVQDSMLIAGKIFKTYNTPAQLAELTSVQLIQLKVDDKEHRRLVLSAVNKAGYIQRPKPLSAEAGSSSDLIKVTSLQKRKRDDDLNEDLPDGPTSEGARYGNMDFEEILDEELLKSKRCVVNRTPVMAAWATVVAERLGFKREEALSIGSVYAGVGAGSKDMPKSGAKRAGKATVGGSAQPYVELMGRRPVLSTQTDEWRGIGKEGPVAAGTAYGYLRRSFRQTTGAVVGAMRVLAASYGADELNARGYALYAAFRPDATGEMRMGQILALKLKP